MMLSNYAVFILTYGRSDSVVTIPTLKASGYTGKIYLVVDDGDKTLEAYKKNYGDDVLVFSKNEYWDRFDMMDNYKEDNTVTFARIAVFDIAEKLGLDYFIVLDDDYRTFNYRFDDEYRYIPASKVIRGIDKVFEAMVEYVAETSVSCMAFAQGGDFIGGKNGGMADAVKTKRKIMNVYVFKTKDRVQWFGRMNDDVNTYIRNGIVGKVLLTTTQVCVEQTPTQTNKGGLTDMYKAMGTYVKSFYSVMASPSSVKINLMGDKYKRMHHVISWRNTVPKIIKQDFKKIARG